MTRALDEFKEVDHPRADDGRFGAGSKAHIVTTHDPDTGETDFHHVGPDKAAAHQAYGDAEDDEDVDHTPEYHAPEIKGDDGQRGDSLHIVHSGDGAAGVDIHGAYLDPGTARGNAVAKSMEAWDAEGPERAELDRDEAEEDEAVQAWNDDHAGDHDDVRIKTNEYGQAERDEAGNLQWEQDGEDVDPGDERIAAFDDVFEGMFPGDERAAYPGFDAANEHFEAAGDHGNVFRVHWHKSLGRDAAPAGDAALTRRDRFALDRASVRRIDGDGHLHVSRTPISKANVCPYYGREIPGADELGLAPERIYSLYRDPDELRKGAASVDGKQLLLGHKPVSADDHAPEMWIGTVSSPEFDDPYLFAKLDIVARDGIGEVQSGRQEQLSCGYRYRADMTPGTAPDGTHYDGVMRDIVFNHVAIVPEGRAGPDVLVLDAKPLRPKDPPMPNTAVPSRTAASARGAFTGGLASGLAVALRPKLAADKRVDVLPLVKGITAKNFKARTPGLVRGLDAAIQGKLARDEEMDAAAIQDVVEQVGELVTQSAPDIAAEVAPEAAATDEGDADLRALLKAKGYTDDEIDRICAKDMPAAGATDADVERAKADAVKGMDAKIAAAKREAADEARRGMVTEDALNDAIASARDAERRINREVREAEAHVSASSVGKLSGAFDSAPDVYRAGLGAMGVKDVDKLPDAGLRALFDAHAGVKAAQTPTLPHLASDAAGGARKGLHERFPNLQRLRG